MLMPPAQGPRKSLIVQGSPPCECSALPGPNETAGGGIFETGASSEIRIAHHSIKIGRQRKWVTGDKVWDKIGKSEKTNSPAPA